MIKKLKFGIIGCSRIAKSSVIPAIIKSDFSTLTNIGSRSLEKAKEYADFFNCKKYGSYEDILKDNEIDIVYISLPVGLHKEWTIKSLNAGKHVLCEKSAAESLESVQKMVKAAQENKKRVLEGLMFRFHPSHKIIKEKIKTNEIGNIFLFHGSYGFPSISKDDIRYQKKLGGGILNDAACYPICASRILFGMEPESVFAKVIFDEISGVDEKIAIDLIYSNKKIARIESGYNLEYKNEYDLWGDGGKILLHRSYNIPEDMDAKISIVKNNETKIIKVNPENHFKLMIEHFCQVITKGKDLEFNFEEEMIKQAKILEAIRVSFTENRIISLKEFE